MSYSISIDNGLWRWRPRHLVKVKIDKIDKIVGAGGKAQVGANDGMSLDHG